MAGLDQTGLEWFAGEKRDEDLVERGCVGSFAKIRATTNKHEGLDNKTKTKTKTKNQKVNSRVNAHAVERHPEYVVQCVFARDVVQDQTHTVLQLRRFERRHVMVPLSRKNESKNKKRH